MIVIVVTTLYCRVSRGMVVWFRCYYFLLQSLRNGRVASSLLLNCTTESPGEWLCGFVVVATFYSRVKGKVR